MTVAIVAEVRTTAAIEPIEGTVRCVPLETPCERHYRSLKSADSGEARYRTRRQLRVRVLPLSGFLAIIDDPYETS